jgi:hypothetical protein
VKQNSCEEFLSIGLNPQEEEFYFSSTTGKLVLKVFIEVFQFALVEIIKIKLTL